MMLLFLLAAQMTNCIPTAGGGQTCITTPPVQMSPVQPVDQHWDQVFDTIRAKSRAKAAGKMLANGDCRGALLYALNKGDFALAEQVREFCSK